MRRRYEIDGRRHRPGQSAEIVPRMLNAPSAPNSRSSRGYPASNEGMIAMERGEVEGAASSWAAVKVGKQEWLRTRRSRSSCRLRRSDKPNCRMRRALPNTAVRLRIGRCPISMPRAVRWGAVCSDHRGIPPDRVKELRAAFVAMVEDADFIAEVHKLNIDLEPLSGAAVQALVEKTLSIPAAVRERAKAFFGR